MNRFTVVILSAFLIWGCGGENSTVEPLSGEQVEPMITLDVDGERVDFFRLLVPSEGAEVQMVDGATLYDVEDTYLMFRSGDGESSFYDRLYNDEGEPVTFAEMYVYAHGEDTPSSVLQSHFSQAARMGRSLDFLTVLEMPEKEVVPVAGNLAAEEDVFVQKLAFEDNSDFTPMIPFHQWEDVGIDGKAWGCFQQNPRPGYGCGEAFDPPSTFVMYACNHHLIDWTGPGSDAGIKSGVPRNGDCVRARGWTRVATAHAHQNADNVGIFAQLYFGPTTLGQWTTFAPAALPEGTWVYADWDTGTSLSSMAMATFRTYPFEGGNILAGGMRYMNGRVTDL